MVAFCFCGCGIAVDLNNGNSEIDQLLARKKSVIIV